MGNAAIKKKNKKNLQELTQDEIDYLLKNSHFTKKELLEWHEGFIVRLQQSTFIFFSFKILPEFIKYL